MPPAQRVRLLVRHMRALGWRTFVFTVDHKYREEVSDPWMVELAGNEFEKIDVRCFDQRKTRKFGIGDLGLRMLPFLFFKLIRQSKKHKPDLVLYPVPPWYIMLIGPFVKWFTGKPYAIDFIDPWVQSAEKNKTFKAKFSQWIARRMEGFAVKRSSAIFAVSKGILNDIVERYPSAKNKPMVAVPYGVELDDYKYIHVNGIGSLPGKPVLRYIGAVSESMLRVVKVFMQALVTSRSAATGAGGIYWYFVCGRGPGAAARAIFDRRNQCRRISDGEARARIPIKQRSNSPNRQMYYYCLAT